MNIDRIVSPDVAPPTGAYCHVTVHGDTAYTAGQLGVDPASGELVEGGIVPEVHQTLANLDAVLRAVGSSLQRALKVNVYLADHDEWGEMNAAFAEHFPDGLPARTAVEVGPLAFDGRVEIDVVAARG
jgi:2-iminobutanoate/2-iminopropanoate deaminase